jgi:guanylate kinase
MINGVIIGGCSGVGKSTVIRRLLQAHPEFRFSVSWTTRKPRAGEEEGIHYHFTSREEFERLIAENGFLEWEKVYEDYYGTPKEVLEAEGDETTVVVFELDTRGALKLKEKYPQFSTIALLPPSIEDLRKRLTQRGSETTETITRRQAYLKKELQRLLTFDFALINEDLEESVELIGRIILALNNRTKLIAPHVEKLLSDLK